MDPTDAPAPGIIKQARVKARLTQAAAAALVYRNVRRWQEWEYGEYDMDPALFEYWLIRAGLADSTAAAARYRAMVTDG